MLITILIFWALILASSFTKKAEEYGFWPYLLSLSLIAGLRSQSSYDYPAYEKFFNEIPTLTELIPNISSQLKEFKAYEIGHLIFNSFVKTFTDNHYIAFILVAGLSLYFILRSLKDYSPNFSLNVLIYFSTFFLLNELGHVRQGIATAFCFFAMRYLTFSYLKYYLFVLLGATFHIGALVFVFFPLALYVLRNRKVTLAILGISLIFPLSFSGQALLEFIANSELMPDKLQNYLHTKYANTLGVFRLKTLKFLFVIGVALFYESELKNKFKYYFLISRAYICGILIFLIFNDFRLFAGRLAEFFIFAESILMCMIIENFSGRWKWVFYALFTSYSLIFVIRFFINSQ